jgi:two-component system OmpR family sensor kinase
VIEIFLISIFYFYYKVEKEHLDRELVLEMKNYSLFFDDDRFDIDVVSLKKSTKSFYELYHDTKHIYILVPLPESREDAIKVFYPLLNYNKLLHKTKISLFRQFFMLSFIAIFISVLFSFYVLSPLRKSLQLLEMFIKDIIHDLNTPLTSILINLKMMEDTEEVENISKSAKTISMLQNNLDSYLKEKTFEREKFDLKKIVQEQVDFFAPIYDYLHWDIHIKSSVIKSDPSAFARIIYNLLSNACKYNTSDGFIKVRLENNTLSISNDSYNGIQNPSKAFERFYKENERGLGIGLHIVEKLCTQLEIEKRLEVNKNIVTVYLDLSQIV